MFLVGARAERLLRNLALGWRSNSALRRFRGGGLWFGAAILRLETLATVERRAVRCGGAADTPDIIQCADVVFAFALRGDGGGLVVQLRDSGGNIPAGHVLANERVFGAGDCHDQASACGEARCGVQVPEMRLDANSATRSTPQSGGLWVGRR